MPNDNGAATAAATYFDAWLAAGLRPAALGAGRRRGFDRQLGQVRGGATAFGASKGLAQIIPGLRIRKVLTAGPAC